MADLVFLGAEPRGDVFVDDTDLTRSVFRATGPQTFYRNPNGGWIWEGHCGKYSDGSTRPPWVNLLPNGQLPPSRGESDHA